MPACVRGGKAAKGNKIYPYLLRGLRVDRPNQVWCADITDLPPLGRFALQIACRAKHSQSVKTTESGGPRGYDAGKKTKGRKRHILTDTDGNLLALVTQTADIQDREGAPGIIMQACESFPTLAHLFADGGYAGEKLRDALADIDGPSVEIVKRPPGTTGFVVIARGWVVERTFAWLGRCRRLAKDWEASIASADAWVPVATIRRSTRYIARKAGQDF